MTARKKEHSTILIVGKSQQMKSIQVKTKHLERWKHYLITVLGVFVILISGIIYLSMSNRQYQAEYQSINNQLVSLKKQMPLAADTVAAKSYVQQIETKLKKVSDYLSRRGVKGFKSAKSGGNTTTNTGLTATETYKLYNDYLGQIVAGITSIPLGYPYYSGKSSTYGYRRDPFRSGRPDFHPGIDIKGRTGAPVKSTANGKVIAAGWLGGYGKCIRIRHANGYETLYGHLSSIQVKNGQSIGSGQIIGRVGSTGHSTGSHLHYEVRLNGRPTNPNKFLHLN